MKIVLINVPLFNNQELRWNTGSHYVPLGLCYIAGLLEKNGYEVKIIDGPFENPTEMELEMHLRELKPDLIGIASLAAATHQATLKTIKIARKTNPNSLIVVGGPHAGENYKSMLEQVPEIDIITRGEAEFTFLELVQSLERKKEFHKIKGIAFRENKKIIATEERLPLMNLDELPFPARHLIDITNEKYGSGFRYKRKPTTLLITSRGCPFVCTFCYKTYGTLFRAHSPEYVVKEIEHLIELGIRDFYIPDDNFFVDIDRVRKICELIIEKKLEITWAVQGTIVHAYKDPEMIRLLAEAGCWYIAFGIESGNKEIIKTIKKPVTLDVVKEVVELTNKYGITTKGYFMIGNLNETVETIEDTINYAKSLPLDTVQFNFSVPYPGTEYYDSVMLNGKGTFDNKAYEKYSGHSNEPIFVPEGLSKEFMMKVQRRAYREFYFRPKYIWSQFKKVDNTKTLLKYCRLAAIYFKKTVIEELPIINKMRY